ncbi:cation/calcium exchanger 1-like [Solanum pennellii]|uniref:Cation/calcium exchanger 1-like n=1 Tax=Solanum pennellii TaxID=28526 RepID=A0ABM1FYX7_SOLPN|nr:cation/calcium exchanger 1-like [Solanum pennellii]XP_015086225.1 cation/calcium exchanger 1-like [Solanum pennellii]
MTFFPFHFKPKSYLSIFLNTSFLFLLIFYTLTSNVTFNHSQIRHIHLSNTINNDCSNLHNFSDAQSKCTYIKENINSCSTKGYLNYLQFFYCTLGTLPKLGYVTLVVWLILLFYLLGNTAAEYFCPCAESLSKVMNLSPAIAGTTLLPLGNGANDVFSSIISFTRSSNSGSVGLNSVLGGAFFISCFVVGVISMLVCMTKSQLGVTIDKSSFIRDVLFIIFTLSCLVGVIIVGRVSVWIAICFTSIYVVYIWVVCVMHFLVRNVNLHDKEDDGFDRDVEVPLLGCIDEEDCEKKTIQMSSSTPIDAASSSCCKFLHRFLGVLELPLYLPRRLTIPVVDEGRWSKPMAVISATLAPILAAFVSSLTGEVIVYSNTNIVILMISVFVGLMLGNVAYFSTQNSSPPKKCLWIWLLGGFVMSTTWTYILAQELVSLLVSFGYILGISPSILGLTVLAWGNSTGDLISNVALALNGGKDGVQMALSACYAGPLFNTLIGLGVSLVLASWWEYPTSFVLPKDPFLFETLGFLILGLLWALVVLPKRNMQPDYSLGVGLLAIYFCFLFLRFAKGF